MSRRHPVSGGERTVDRPAAAPGASTAVLAVLLAVVLVTPGCTQGLLGTGLRSSWAYEMTQVEALLDEGLTGAGVTVAVVDTGIDATHPDLQGVSIRWRDLVGGRASPYDDHGHGTHVAGLIVAQPRESDLRGGAPDVELLVVKAIDSEGRGDDGTVAQAIRWAADRGADVISLSLGGGRLPILGSQTEDAAKNAVARGIYVVAAAGNDGENDDGTVATPANVPGVIAVGAVDRDRRLASFTSRGSQSEENIPGIIGIGQRQDPDKKPEVVAPGVGVASTVPRGGCDLCTDSGYGSVSGTSQAVPFVTSAIALVLEDDPSYQREGSNGGGRSAIDHVKRALMSSALTVPGQSTPHDDRAGYGIVQARGMRDRV